MCVFMCVFVVCNPVAFMMRAGIQRMGGGREEEAYTGRSILADDIATEGGCDVLVFLLVDVNGLFQFKEMLCPQIILFFEVTINKRCIVSTL